MVGKNSQLRNGFLEEDIQQSELEIYEVADDLSLSRLTTLSNVPLAQRGGSNKENVAANVTEPDRMQSILAKIGPDDNVELFKHFFEEVEKNQNQITAVCLGCGNSYKGPPNVNSNFVTHLKVCNSRCFCIHILRSLKSTIEFMIEIDFCYSCFQRKHVDAFVVYDRDRKRKKVKNTCGAANALTQSQFDNLLQKFMVDGLKTYSIVEEPAFRDFVHGKYSNILWILNPSLSLLNNPFFVKCRLSF